MPRMITATYRLQLTREFPIARAREIVGYLHSLGVSHVYLSPVLAARAGSTHGYDVTDHTRLNPELGTEDDLRALAADLHARRMGIVVDIVPNHMSASEENLYWDDVLERGRGSRFADWFDIDWDAPRAAGRIVLPVLGDTLDAVLERGELKPRIRDSGSRIEYLGRSFPLDAATLPREFQLAQFDPSGRPAVDDWFSGAAGKRRMRALIDAQHYRLAGWRRGAADINYRRFFDVGDLVCIRMETDAIFDATHALLLRWVHEGLLDGLRVDHVDGLRFPAWYLAKLRERVDAERHEDAPAPLPIYVEKILSGSESLPAWPVQGTTGYDFLNDVEELFLDPAGYARIEARYRALRHRPALRFRSVAQDSKRRALLGALRPDVLRVARLAHEWRPAVSVDAAAAAIVAVIARLRVYRTYIGGSAVPNAADLTRVGGALRSAREENETGAAAIALLEDAFMVPPVAVDTVRAELIERFQQLSGPAAAKGVEDTALYSYMPLVSRNEVGGAPDRPLDDAVARMHERNAARAHDWPGALLATNTHDTKRSADLRSRLDVLTQVPDEWARSAARWRRLNAPHRGMARGSPAPDPNAEYLFYQTLLGLWPAPRPGRRVDDLPDRAWLERARDRVAAYMLKAAREAKTRTSWTESDAQYEHALSAFVRGVLDDRDALFPGDVARLAARTARAGFAFALARVMLQCASPGVPDTYQGDELWTFSLVDPDNRQPVDFQKRAALLGALGAEAVLRECFLGGPGSDLSDPRVKLALLTRLLRVRSEHADLFTHGDYIPLLVGAEPAAWNVFAFARRAPGNVCICLARVRAASSSDARIPAVEMSLPDEFAGRWRSVLTGREIEVQNRRVPALVTLDELVGRHQPCELLMRPQ